MANANANSHSSLLLATGNLSRNLSSISKQQLFTTPKTIPNPESKLATKAVDSFLKFNSFHSEMQLNRQPHRKKQNPLKTKQKGKNKSQNFYYPVSKKLVTG